MTKIDNKRKLDEEVLKKLQDILQENVELLNTYNFKKLYDIFMTTSVIISELTYLLMTAGIDPLKYMNEVIDNYFSYNNDLISIDIPGNITSIGNNAFYGCERLTSVTIGKGVNSIGDFAFAFCGELTSITIPDSVTSIGYEAFYKCSSLTSITIPNSVTSIGGYAFQSCSRLMSVIIGNGATFIDVYTFYDCNQLKSINYLGTKEQWNDLLNGQRLEGIPIDCIIHCKDGDINLK